MPLIVLIFVFLSGLTNLLGGYAGSKFKPPSERAMAYLLSGVAGFLLAAVFLDMIPAISQENVRILGFAFVGYVLIYGVEGLIPATAHDHGHEIVVMGDVGTGAAFSRAASWSAILGLAAHAFFDGVAIAGGFQGNLVMGILFFLALTMHKFPVSFSLSTVMRVTGFNGRAAVTLGGGLLGLTTFLGGLTGLTIGGLSPVLETTIQAVAAGVIIYLGATDLIPAARAADARYSAAFTIAGALLFYLSFTFLGVFGLS